MKDNQWHWVMLGQMITSPLIVCLIPFTRPARILWCLLLNTIYFLGACLGLNLAGKIAENISNKKTNFIMGMEVEEVETGRMMKANCARKRSRKLNGH